jgi:pilus assembly protein CpaB
MNMRSILPLLLALGVGAVTVLYGRSFMQQQRSQSAGGGPVDVRQVVIAVSDMPIGHAIVDGDFRTVEAPLELIPDQSLHEVKQTSGRVLCAAITRGQMLTEALLAPIGSSQGLEATIPRGKRAFTVDVSETTGLAGMILPGSRVDIVTTMTDDKTNESRTWTMLQNAPVTAVGTRLSKNGPDEASGKTLVKTVTLLVTPEQAEMLDMAYTRSHPRLVLRNQAEGEADYADSGITFSEFFHRHETSGTPLGDSMSGLLTRLAAAKQPGLDNDATAKPPIAVAAAPVPVAEPPRRSVEVVRGGVSTTVYFEGPGGSTAGGPAVASKTDPFATVRN